MPPVNAAGFQCAYASDILLGPLFVVDTGIDDFRLT